ncbi:hypothetical protein GGR54DRAFT_591099 [Hypoxylon sp. NC1633]|nr:hypothetical protein GGR54DRAFT_591099 [Hypoxylon sp. NC1633]
MWLAPERQSLSSVFLHLLLSARPILGQGDSSISTTHDATKPTSSVSSSPQPTCESRTINYITHTLPQQCLTSPPSAFSTPESVSATTASPSSIVDQAPSPSDSGTAIDHDEELDADGNDLSTGAFMSFEEWKAMMLEKSGQEELEPRNRKARDPGGDAYPVENFDSLGDEGEVSLDFDAYSDRISEITSDTKPSQKDKDKERQVEKVTYDEGLAQGYRSKDAGKTSRERFSYASFDAGATVKKASPGAKNAKAILVENKDSYMLLECAMENKFVIVELSDDILVDTVVLANFEFFSSMIRLFRVSVSDRYPVKLEKWKILGTFEARNSRDIQPFIVENPQIWARYLRIEILGHYGNEYYCPVSLLRVHGTRMLDSWKEADPADLESEEDGNKPIPEGSEENVEVKEAQIEEDEVVESAQPETQTVNLEQCDWVPFWDESYFYYEYPFNLTCAANDAVEPTSQSKQEQDESITAADSQPPGAAEQTASVGSSLSSSGAPTQESASQATTESAEAASSNGSGEATSSTAVSNSTESVSVSTSSADSATARQTSTPTTLTPPSLAKTANAQQSSKTKTAASTSLKPPSSRSIPSKGQPSGSPTTPRNKTSTTTSAAASSPTVQDSFFKALTKRLQALESNTTLSLQYIESQSRFLQEALARLERRQVAKVDLFLDTLNKTVLGELRDARARYDQVWQSTVIALETQREQSEREIVALGSRLGVLADEVVFQKRMAIFQSLLLLGCLVLVIFSRGGIAGGVESYYPSQFLLGGAAAATSSSSRVALPPFPSTPTPKRPGPDPASVLLSVDDASPQARLRRSPSQTPDSAAAPSRRRARGDFRKGDGGSDGTPESAGGGRRRPSPGRASTEPASIPVDYYQEAPSPSSGDMVGYDSEPALTPTADADYYSATGTSAGVSIYAETLARKSERQLTPSSETDGVERISLPSRPSLTHGTSARKPLPALPEDPD